MSSPVNLTLDTSLVDEDDAAEMGAMYLPDDDIGNRWAIDQLTWRPSDASLAALPFPLCPDTDTIGEAPPVSVDGPVAYYAQVVVAGVPQTINPGAEGNTFLGGTLSGVELRISDKTITARIGIARRIPKQFATASPSLAVSYADVAADFPAVDYDDVDPALSYYDVRLAHP